jgi:hypothetical protein
MSTLINTIINPVRKIIEKTILLFLANQLGRKISKLSLLESEYFLAKMVNGQNILKRTNIIPSPKTNPMAIQVYIFIVLLIPVYKI